MSTVPVYVSIKNKLFLQSTMDILSYPSSICGSILTLTIPPLASKKHTASTAKNILTQNDMIFRLIFNTPFLHFGMILNAKSPFLSWEISIQIFYRPVIFYIKYNKKNGG